MNKNLLLGLLSAALLCGGVSQPASAGIVLEENFDQFTEGTNAKPADVNIGESGKLGELLLGWSGDAVYEAGGALFVGSTDIFDFDSHSLKTPDLDLKASDGNIRITLRVKSWTSYGNMININSDSGKLSSPYFEDGDWHDFVIVTDKDLDGALSLSSASAYSTAFFVDYLKIEQGEDILMPPTSLRPTDYNGSTFTARWLSVKGASSYTVSVYNKDAAGARINEVAYDAEALPEGDTSGNHVVVTVTDSSLKYYFTVVAKQGESVSDESNESEVIKFVESLQAPVALKPTNVTKTGFTANWTAVPDAETYTASLYKTVTLTEDAYTDIIYEDFEGIKKGSFDLISLPDKDPSLLDDYTHQPGWYASAYAFGGGSLVLWPMFGTGYFVTPSLDLSNNDGIAFVDFSAAVGDGGSFKTGDKVTVDLLTQNDGETTVLESVDVTIDEKASKSYEVMLTKGVKGSFVRISYSGSYELHVDDMAVVQKAKAGDKIRAVVKQVATDGLSADFEYAPADNTEYSYRVVASVNTITTFGMDDVVTSDASNEIAVDGAGAVEALEEAGFKVYTAAGKLHINASEPMPVSVVDAYGRTVASFVARQGDNAVDCSGFVVVCVGGKAVKAVVH